MPEPVAFGARLAAAISEHGALCLGIDPHARLLAEWGLTDDASGVREFGLRVVEAAAGRLGVVKPQVAFFERFGAAGFAALEDVIRAGRDAGLLVIADGKRGDIGSTMDGYGEAWLRPGAALEADALTIYAYQGLEANAGVLDLAAESGKGLFVVTATSNPEARAVQSAVRTEGAHAGASLAAALVREIGAHNAGADLGSVGVVIGATIAMDDFGITADDLARTPILAPGFGFQGARLGDLANLYGAVRGNVVASVSRSVLGAGPDGIVAAIGTARAELLEASR